MELEHYRNVLGLELVNKMITSHYKIDFFNLSKSDFENAPNRFAKKYLKPDHSNMLVH